MTDQATQTPRIEIIEKVWTPDAKLWIPYESGETGFAYPSFGPDTYLNVGQEILGNNLQVPVGEPSSDLVYAAYCGPEMVEDKPFRDSSQMEDVRSTMKNRWFHVFVRNLFADNGIYAILDPQAKGRTEQFDVDGLEKRLKGGKEIKGFRFSEDKTVRFAPEGSYKVGDHTSESLAKDGMVIINYGFRGAGQLGEVSAQSTYFKNNPRTYGVKVEKDQSPILRVSALYGGGGRLLVGGGDFGGVCWCHAFGVLESCEADAKK